MIALRLRRALVARLELMIGLGGAATAVAVGYGLSHYGIKLVAVGIIGAAVLAATLVWVEIGYGVVFFAALIAPALVGYGAWTPALVLVVGVVTLRELLQGRMIPLWGPMLVYIGAYIVVGVHGDINAATPQAIVRYVLPPVFALVTAAATRDSKTRNRILILLCAATSVQIAVATSQALQGIGTYGRGGFVQFSDAVTGTLGGSASGLLALIGVGVATVLFALSLERVWRPKLLMIAAIVLCALGIVSVARAVFIFVPVAFGCVLLSGGFFARRSIGLKRVVAVGTVLVALTPGLVIGMSTLYPGVTQDLNSVAKIRDYLFLNTRNSGPTPERGEQLSLALAEFGRFSGDDAILGKGAGTTWLEADTHFVSSQDAPVILKSQEFANSVWVPRILLEGGILGVAAFAWLLGALVNLTRRARPRVPGRTADSALLVSLPGLVGLAFVAGFYLPVLASPPFATIFWTLVGISLAISRAYPERSG